MNKYMIGASAVAVLTALGTSGAMAQLDEIVVTATKKSENLQDVPIAVQAFGEKQLDEQNVQSFDDYVKYLPSVNAGGRGPGQNEIYIRGAAIDAINITVAESQGSAPNVALYLDEQPVTAGGRNLDVYVTDMERIEVLPGPQGTLYGASSMAGTVRLITNKPVLNEFDASVSSSYSFTRGGEDSTSVEAMVNIPVIEDKLAIRAAVYTDSQGGYIDNVAGTFTADSSINPAFPGATVSVAAGSTLADGTVVATDTEFPVAFTTADNSNRVEDDFNDATYQGIRLGAKYVVNDNWDVLLQHARQTLKTEGVWDFDPSKGDLNVSRFADDYLDDSFTQTAWTVNGRMGALDLVYTGAYLDREVEASIDYTGYTNIGRFIAGYQCEYLVGSFYNGIGSNSSQVYNFDPTYSGDPGVVECGDPTNAARISNTNERWTHEARVTTQFDGPLNFTAGVFYEDFLIEHVGRFNYQAPIDAGFAPIDVSSNANFDDTRSTLNTTEITSATQFRNDNDRQEEQFAVFGNVTWDITDQFKLDLGARYYDLEYSFTGVGTWRYGNRPSTNATILADPDYITPGRTGGRSYVSVFNDLNPIQVDDTLFKATATWTPNSDMLFYVAWSEGYRPPGFNRAVSTAAGTTDGPFTPTDNNIANAGSSNPNAPELQCGTDVAIDANDGPDAGDVAGDNSSDFPGLCLPYIFESDTLENLEFGWKTTLADGNVRFNGAIYKVDWKNIQVSNFDSQNVSVLTYVLNGADAEILGAEADLQWAVSDNLTVYAAGSWNDTELVRVDPALDFLIADAGSPLPLTPEFQLTARARYEWDISSDKNAWWQVGGKYAGESVNSLIDEPNQPQLDQDAYFLLDASIGVADSDAGWKAELFGTNLTDERAELNINRQDFIQRTTTNRPQTIGIRFSYDLN